MKRSKFATWTALTLGGLLALCSVAGAQDDQSQPKTDPPAAAARGKRPAVDQVQRIKKQLSLTDDQVEKLKPVMNEQREKMTALVSDTSLSRKEKMAKRKDLQTGLQDKVKAILTPDQFAKWEKLRQDHVQNRRGQQPDATQKPAEPDKQP